MEPRTPRTKKPATGLTVALSVVLVPAAAIAAVALTRPVEPVRAAESTQPVAASTSIATAATAAPIVIEPVSSSEADLIAACTVDGIALVGAEASGEITELQSAALDALRQLCAEAGLEMPGPPAPPPVVKTVTVAGPTTPPDDDGDDDGEHGGGDDDDDHGRGDDDDDDDERDDDGEHSASRSAYEAALQDAQAAIAAARDVGVGNGALQDAYEKLDEAKRNAARGDYREATEKAREAERKAKKALDGDD